MRRVLIVLMFFLSIGTVSAQTGPVLDIRMDEGDGKTVADSSGNGNDGTHYGNTRLLMHFDGDANDSSSYGNDGTVNGATLTTGVWGNGLEFDGDGDYVNISHSPEIDFTLNDSYTISVWVYPSGSTDSAILEKWEGGSPYPYVLRLGADKKFRFTIYNFTNANSVISTSSISLNNWYHIVGVNNGTHLILYVNGVLNATKEITITGEINNTKPLYLGIRGNYLTPFNGTIDEVAIYSKALSPLEISDLYNAKKAKFTDWTDGKVGNALEFDGKDDYVQVLNTGNYLNGSSAFTILTWVKRSGSNAGPWYSTETIVSNYYHRLWLGKESDGQFHGRFYNGASPSYDVDSGFNIVNGAYYHVGITYNSTTFSIYINGELKNSIPASGTLNLNNLPHTYIGHDANFGIYPAQWNGTIDEVRIWNHALTEDEIYWQYHWNEYYTKPIIAPRIATEVTGTVLWTGLDQQSDVELSLASPSGIEYTKDSAGAEARAKSLDSVTVTLPIIDYSLTLNSGYERLTVPVDDAGDWELRVRSRNVTEMEVEGGWK